MHFLLRYKGLERIKCFEYQWFWIPHAHFEQFSILTFYFLTIMFIFLSIRWVPESGDADTRHLVAECKCHGRYCKLKITYNCDACTYLYCGSCSSSLRRTPSMIPSLFSPGHRPGFNMFACPNGRPKMSHICANIDWLLLPIDRKLS